MARTVTGISLLSKEFAASSAYFDLTYTPLETMGKIYHLVKIFLTQRKGEI